MDDRQARPGGWWRKTLPFRVLIYLAIIVFLIYARNRVPAPPAEPELPTTKNLPPQEPEETQPAELSQAFPEATFYFWSVAPREDGGQTVTVMLKFEKNVQDLEWKELKLRGPGTSKTDLASAVPPPAAERPGLGYAKVTFELPPGAAEFTEGRVHCWVQDLFQLPADRKISPEALQDAYEKAQASSV